MTRLLRHAALVGVLTTAALAAGCGGGTPATVAEPVSFEELADAASTSARATTGRFGFSMEMTLPDASEPFAFSGEGAFDAPAKRASLTFDFSSFASLLGDLFAGAAGDVTDAPDFGDPSAWRLEAVQDGDVAYMRLPAVSGEALPNGKSWVRTDLSKAGETQGFDFSQLEQFTSSDPRKLLEVLRAASGEIETVGRETLRGGETTHYRATLDLAEFDQVVPEADREQLGSMLGEIVDEAGLGEVPVDVWLDDAGLVRKLMMSFSATQPGTTESADVAMTFELWDYGEPVDIELPPASEVVDESDVTD